MWLISAVLSAVFAGVTSVLAKCGIKKTDSDLATAIRTGAVLLFSVIMVFISGAQNDVFLLDGKSVLFIILSGSATGASWIFYFKAISTGDINKVVPIDKSSTVLTVILAILLFGETESLASKLIGSALMTIGILLMLDKKKQSDYEKDSKWLIYAILSAVFASLTSILAKYGMSSVDSNLGTALRMVVVLIFAWIIVIARGKQKEIKSINKKELGFILLSGLTTGASWIFYYYAIKNGQVSVVVPIDKLSIVITVIFSYIIFKEKLSRKTLLGLIIMVTGILIMSVL